MPSPASIASDRHPQPAGRVTRPGALRVTTRRGTNASIDSTSSASSTSGSASAPAAAGLNSKTVKISVVNV